MSIFARPACATQDIRDVELLGIQIGMTSDSALSLLTQRFGRRSISLEYAPCLRDALLALGNRENEAPAKCIVTITAQSEGENITVNLVEALAERRYGSSSVWKVTLHETTPTESDKHAFIERAFQHLDLGAPSSQGGSWYAFWYEGDYTASEAQKYYGLLDYEDYTNEFGAKRRVQWDHTPYSCGGGSHYEAGISSTYSIEMDSPVLLCENALVYHQRTSQPTVRYDF